MEEPKGKKLTETKSGLRMVPTCETFASPFALEEPVWVPDKEVSGCIGCNKNFDFWNRKHHCRRCGKCFCGNCCGHRMSLQRMYFVDPVRHCYDCALISKEEEEFYGKGIKILLEGSHQNIEQECLEEPVKLLGAHLCRLSQDQRSIEFSEAKHGDLKSLKSAYLSNVIGMQVVKEPQSPKGKQIVDGIQLKYKDNDDTTVTHCLVLRKMDHKSVPWLVWIHKALKMTFEARNQMVHG